MLKIFLNFLFRKKKINFDNTGSLIQKGDFLFSLVDDKVFQVKVLELDNEKIVTDNGAYFNDNFLNEARLNLRLFLNKKDIEAHISIKNLIKVCKKRIKAIEKSKRDQIKVMNNFREYFQENLFFEDIMDFFNSLDGGYTFVEVAQFADFLGVKKDLINSCKVEIKDHEIIKK